MAADTLLADKAFDADQRVIEPLQAAGKTAVIPPKSNRKILRDYDKETYRRAISSKISSANSNNIAQSLRATTKPPETFSPQSTSLLLSFGSIEDRP
jgi:hypothetical protein